MKGRPRRLVAQLRRLKAPGRGATTAEAATAEKLITAMIKKYGPSTFHREVSARSRLRRAGLIR